MIKKAQVFDNQQMALTAFVWPLTLKKYKQLNKETMLKLIYRPISRIRRIVPANSLNSIGQPSFGGYF